MRTTYSLVFIPYVCIAGEFIGMKDIGNNSYLDARYLNHSIGRFITQDPIKQFNSQYAYGNGRIIVHSDPSGLMMADDEFFSSMSDVRIKETKENEEYVRKVSRDIEVSQGAISKHSNVIKPETKLPVKELPLLVEDLHSSDSDSEPEPEPKFWKTDEYIGTGRFWKFMKSTNKIEFESEEERIVYEEKIEKMNSRYNRLFKTQKERYRLIDKIHSRVKEHGDLL